MRKKIEVLFDDTTNNIIIVRSPDKEINNFELVAILDIVKNKIVSDNPMFVTELKNKG